MRSTKYAGFILSGLLWLSDKYSGNYNLARVLSIYNHSSLKTLCFPDKFCWCPPNQLGLPKNQLWLGVYETVAPKDLESTGLGKIAL